MTLTFDGFIASSNNDLDWFTPPIEEEFNSDIVSILERVDSWISGYQTGPGLVAYWKNAEKSEQTEKWELRIARAFNKLRPIVISKKEERVDPEVELVLARNEQELKQKVTEIKERNGRDIYLPGGVRTAQEFVRCGLVDEFILMVHPLAIGEGKRLFTGRTKLELVSAKSYKSGVIQVRYLPIFDRRERISEVL